MNDKIDIRDYINVREKAKQLDCNIPDGISLLPRNFAIVESKDELVHEGTVDTIRKLWKQNNIQETWLEKSGEKYPCITEHAFEWIGPTIFVSASFLVQNPDAVGIALNLISIYLKDWFKGILNTEKKVKISIVVEKNKSKTYSEIRYEGSPEGLKELPSIIKRAHNE